MIIGLILRFLFFYSLFVCLRGIWRSYIAYQAAKQQESVAPKNSRNSYAKTKNSAKTFEADFKVLRERE